VEYDGMAKKAAGASIFCELSNLNQDESGSSKIVATNSILTST
jgi:hypothetical protein